MTLNSKTKPHRRQSIFRALQSQVVVMLLVLMLVGIAALVWNLSRLSSELVRSSALKDAKRYTQALTEFRTLYTSEVVSRLGTKGIEVTHDYSKREGAIPLPATLTKILAEQIGKHEKGAWVRLYSDYPFPWRKDGGPKDDIEREALRFLRENPEETFVHFEQVAGRSSLRYATADLMRPACVGCHNSHPDSPKTDWRIGDVRGVLEIVRPLASAREYQTGFRGTLAAMGSVIIFSLSGIGVALVRLRGNAKALQKANDQLEQRVAERTADLSKSNEELKQAHTQLETTLRKLKDAQETLVLQEKMASLGGLTAGIAHEIKNPLNFVTNFAELSADLTAELREELAAHRDKLEPATNEELTELLSDLEQNVQKINEYGKRADNIVRGMLLHSRGVAGQRELTDLNALLDEYVKLAYHGMRAKDTEFNVNLEHDYDPSVGKLEVVPQDISRAFLNVVNNACYAADQKKKQSGNEFEPTVRVSTKNLGDRVEVRIRDNGNGVPKALRDKIFNPFFTTKPTGTGTGLGLSLSYEIVVAMHKGEMRVETEEGQFAEFTIVLPRHANDHGERGPSA